MNSLRRHLAVLRASTRLSLLIAMQYRWEFMLDGFFSLFWTATAVIPLWFVFEEREVIAGWRYGEALLVIGWFTVLQGLLKGAINPSLTTVIEQIRTGTLDFVLLKPADAQFLVSTARFRPWQLTALVGAGAVFGYGFWILERSPTLSGVLQSLVMLGAAVITLYSVWILVICVAFRAVRVDNLRYLFEAVFEAGRWPSTVFKGLLSFLFTFVIPLALMTTYPAEALMERLPLERFVGGWAGALAFALFARFVWSRSIASYTSASS